nr:Hint domain-containing protein [uncultured Rhodopila sp.]
MSNGHSGGCYMQGVRIRTARGEQAVETISAGDAVAVIRGGEEVMEPVKWIGFTAVDLSSHAYVEDAAPIRIRAGAIAENEPVRDLFLSPEHCLILDDRCVAAKLLVNGGSIVSERAHAPFTYYHLELEKHGILLAENTAAESYLDTGNRSVFDNSGAPRQLHPTFKFDAHSERWLTDACAPLANATEVEAIWTRLADRSVSIGFAIPEIITVENADIRLVADGEVIVPTSARDSRYVFMVPAGVSSVTLASRFCIPSDKMLATNRDTRRLGVCVNWIAIRSENAETILSADHPGLQDGWYDVEGQGKSISRWTDGTATIPWENVTGATMLTVCCTPVDQYPLYDDKARLVA